MSTREQAIFKQGSTTYYWSAKFFPPRVRDDVFRLYSFVRVADDYVDSVPQQTKAFMQLRRATERALATPAFVTEPADTDTTDERVVKNILSVARTHGFEPAWLASFLDAMEADLRPRTYLTLTDSLGYVYGSAEVIGLMMSRIMGLPRASDEAAKMQGRAMQWINFIRDVAEDNSLGRCYFPQEDLRRFNLPDLMEVTARAHPNEFRAFMRYQIARYRQWQAVAETGYRYIPPRPRIPLRTAAGMYDWTAEQIASDPLVVFDRKVKPSPSAVVWAALRQTLCA